MGSLRIDRILFSQKDYHSNLRKKKHKLICKIIENY